MNTNILPAEDAEAPSLNTFKDRVDLFVHDYMYSLEESLTIIISFRALIISDSATGHIDIISVPILLLYCHESIKWCYR